MGEIIYLKKTWTIDEFITKGLGFPFDKNVANEYSLSAKEMKDAVMRKDSWHVGMRGFDPELKRNIITYLATSILIERYIDGYIKKYGSTTTVNI